jgi:hypothetical protein
MQGDHDPVLELNETGSELLKNVRRMCGEITANFFSFIVRYIQMSEDILILCATGTVGSVTTACAVHASGIAVEQI